MFNFKKNANFSASLQPEPSQEDAATRGVLAVWGSPGSGKTVVATKIAHYLAEKKKDVVLLLADMAAPMLPCIVPPSELEVQKSLGDILLSHTMTESLLRDHLVTLKHNNHLSIAGLLKGENEYKCGNFPKELVVDLLNTMQKIAPFVIVDCSSYIASDVLSAIALREADEVLRLANCDLKSISYLSSQLPLLNNHGFNPDRHYKVASNVKPQHGAEKMAGALGSLAFNIPYSAEVEEQYLAGNLLTGLVMKNSRDFKTEIQKICAEVFNVR